MQYSPKLSEQMNSEMKQITENALTCSLLHSYAANVVNAAFVRGCHSSRLSLCGITNVLLSAAYKSLYRFS